MSACTSFHVVQIAGTVFYIDSDVRQEIESFLRNTPAPTDFIVVDSLNGEEVTVIADAVNGIWSCTPETRAAQREMDAMFKAEIPVTDL